jgi:hypothetical protein
MSGDAVLTIPEFRKPVDHHFRRVKRSFCVLLVLCSALMIVIQVGNPDEWVRAHIFDSAPRWLVSFLPIATLVAFLYFAAWVLVV